MTPWFSKLWMTKPERRCSRSTSSGRGSLNAVRCSVCHTCTMLFGASRLLDVAFTNLFILHPLGSMAP
jgi:hypothetical protein